MNDGPSTRTALLVGDAPARGRRLNGARLALGWDGGARTYAEFDDRVRRLAAMFAHRGVTEETRLALLAPNCPEFLEVVLAVSLVGATVVPVNLRLAASEARFVLDDSGATHGVYHPAAGELASDAGLADRSTWVMGPELEGAIARSEAVPPQRPDHDGPVVQMYTSGTTGRSKGCMLGNGALLATAANVAATAGFRAHDVYVCWAPLFHRGGLDLALSVLLAGGMVVLAGSGHPDTVWSLVEQHGGTSLGWMPGDPAMFRHPAATRLGGQLGPLVHGAALDDPETFELLRRRAPNARYCGSYGLTEAGICVTTATADDEVSRPGTIGRPSPLCDVAVRDSEGRELPHGSVGEICVRGPTTMSGYWRQPEATAEATAQGWLRTGDLARRDEEGFLYFAGRSKDMVKSGGENVYSVEVEAVLLQHPAVDEAIVFGVPDARWGEAVKAVIVPAGGSELRPAELDAFCLERMSAFKRPRWYEFATADDVPRTNFRKPAKAVLREVHDPSRAVRLTERT